MDYGFKQDIMRNNADMSKWASWQQQQTIDELKRLKLESSATVGRLNGAKTLDAQLILSKNSRLLSKFTARKLNSSTVGANGGGNGSQQTGNGQISSLAGLEWPESAMTAVRKLEQERDALIREKAAWLNRFSEDNSRLAQMLKDVAITKEKLIRKMESLDVEKDKLRSLQINFAQNRFERSFFAGSKLGPGNRATFTAQGRGAKAEEVFQKLQAVWAKCKSNQLEVIDYAVSCIKDTEAHMVAGNDAEADAVLEQLESLASGRPGNILAAEALSANLSEAVVNALMERNLAPLLMNSALTQDPRKTEEFLFDGVASVQPTTALTYNDIKEILAQNESLKGQLTQMRTKYAQLKAKALATPQAVNPSHPHSIKSGNTSFMPENSQVAASSQSDIQHHLDTRVADPDETTPLDHEAARRGSELSADDIFDRFPEIVKKKCLQLLQEKIKQDFAVHPLYTVSLVSFLSADVIAETTREIAEQSRGLFGVLLTSRDETQSAIIALGEQDQQQPIVDDRDNDAMASVVSAAVEALQTVPLEVEVATMLTMALTFLHQRYAVPH